MEFAVEDIASLNERLRSIHLRSDTCEWATPQEFFDSLNKEFGFELDVCATEANEGRATAVCLVPARTDTNWWHEYVSQADQVRFVKGRLKFGGHAKSAPFPSAGRSVPGTQL